MKRKILLSSLLLINFTIFAQQWQSAVGKLYVTPDSTKVGIGISNPMEKLHVNGGVKIGNSTSAVDRNKNILRFGDGNYVSIGEWEADDMLSLMANKFNFVTGNVGIGVSAPTQKLDVNGRLYLRAAESTKSFIHWQWNTLVMGTLAGVNAHNSIDLIPGGSDNTNDTLFTRICMYESPNTTTHNEKIELWTAGNCWFLNKGNFGIGTQTPQYKLDVKGTIRANEILVTSPTGADFVFDKEYKLPSLNEVKSYIQENKHLPEIPSATEMQENGVSLDKLVIQLLQKVEELTIYTIQQEERIKELENNQK